MRNAGDREFSMQNRRAETAVRFRSALVCAVAFTLLSSSPVLLAENPPSGGPKTFSSFVGPFIDTYCITCHSSDRKKGEIDLERFEKGTDLIRAPRVWTKIKEVLAERDMPPQNKAQPSEEERAAMVDWIDAELAKFDCSSASPGRVTARRLNRAEYDNTVRDLLGVGFQPSEDFPADDIGYGFDNIADVLTVSPMLTERYLAAARKISQLAVGDLELTPNTEIFEVDKLLRQDVKVSEDLPFGSRGGISVDHYFPTDGEYVARIFLLRTYNGVIRGLHEPNDLEVRLNGELIQSIKVGRQPGEQSGTGPDAEGVEIRFFAKAGPATLGVNFVDDGALAEGMLRPYYAITSYEYAGDRVEKTGIARVELRGPYGELSRGDTPARRKIFSCRPASSESQDEEYCATRIIDNIGRLAYRETLSDIQLQTLLGSYRSGRAQGDFDSGIEMALRRILVSTVSYTHLRAHETDS